MTFLFVFPHPDDESFGPAPLLWKLHRQGHRVHLLTLTRGEATRQRERLGVSHEEMGRIRTREMACVARVLALDSLEILDFADGTLARQDPLELENVLTAHVRRLCPDVLVTYAVHGISGHPDHLETHAAVKRIYCALRRDADAAAPKRLAFFTLPPSDDPARSAHLKSSPWDQIGVVEPVDDEDLARGHEALACYETYRPVIDEHQPLRQILDGVCFELFGESPAPRRSSLTEGLGSA